MRALIVLAAFLLFGCATPVVMDDAATRAMLVGKWYGEYEDAEAGLVRFLSDRSADGTYVVEFREGGGFPYFEAGIWDAESGVYSTNFEKWTFMRGPDEESYPAEPPVRDRYKIVSLTKDLFEYELIEEGSDKGRPFSAVRVGDDFEIPTATTERNEPRKRLAAHAE